MEVKVNGSIYDAEFFISKTPITIFISDLHVEVCNSLAESKFKKGSLDFKIYVNLVIRKSLKAKLITSLLFLTRNKLFKVDSIDDNLISTFLLDTAGSENLSSSDIALLNPSLKKTILFKFLVHRIFHLFAKRKYSKKQVVRAYVDVSEYLFGDIFNDSEIILFPFALGLKRQISFYRSVKKRFKNAVSLDGIKYSFKDFIAVISQSTGNGNFDRKLVQFEKRGYISSGELFAKQNIGQIYGTDDFEAGAIALHSTLMDNGVKTFNKAHGVSQTCPYVIYNKFEVLTCSQFHFYKTWNPDLTITLKDAVVERKEYSRNSKVVFVFIEGNVGYLPYEMQQQKKIISLLNGIMKKTENDFLVKLHPNTPLSDVEYLKELNIRFQYSNEYDDMRPVFLTIFSTSYFTFLGLGPFFAVTDEFMDVRLILDKDIDVYLLEKDQDNFIVKMNSLKDANTYSTEHQNQILRLESRKLE